MFKFIFLGNDLIGKTNLISSILKENFNKNNNLLFKYYKKKINFENKEFELQIWDPITQNNLENLRILLYPNTDIFFLCFSVIDPLSFNNLSNFWLKELKKFFSKPNIILIGTKIDLRNKYLNENKNVITFEEGKLFSNEIKSIQYIECSSLLNININLILEISLNYLIKKNNKNNCLII